MAEYSVKEILKSVFDGKDSNNWVPADKIPLVTKRIEDIKNDIRNFSNSNIHDIGAVLQEARSLYSECKKMTVELESCQEEIELQTMAEVIKSIEHHDVLITELERLKFALDIVYEVVQCGKYVKEFDDGREAQSFTRAVEAVYDLLQFIDMPAEGFRELDMYSNTKNTAQLILDTLLLDLYAEWDRLVAYTVKPGPRKTVISITLRLDESRIVIDVINALNKSKKLTEKISEFSNILLKDVLIPIIQNDCTISLESEELITITINHKQNFKPSYGAVIGYLRLLFHYLGNKLNIEFATGITIMRLIGKEICGAFRDVMVKDCLMDTIPNNINELHNYGQITSEIEDFQRFLSVINFFPDEKFSILQYVSNIDVLFAEKTSQYFLETARTIMLKDLSASMSIGVQSIPEPQAEANAPIDQNAENALKVLDNTIPKSLFFFPRCMISKTAQELLDLVYVMMEQAVQCSDVVCRKLYVTSRLIFELYDAIVPYHHEEYLQNIPQYVALFHNNCMYLAHNLQTLGDKWFTLMDSREVLYPISFVDLVQKLRDLGYKHLTVHMQQQRKQILDNVRSSDLNSIVVKDVLSDNAEAAIRQCLRQLQLLKNVWIGVFPNNVFVRLMATLVNMFVDELIHRVCTVEDISMEIATQLTDIYTLVMQKAPALFQDPSDIETYVPSWLKLHELIFVLSGSLKDIETRWKEGTGPLAVHFKTEELRSLIKALFQNTQFRANLLSKIK